MEESGDTVNLLDHSSIKKILLKNNEKLLLSCAVQKFNRKDVRQDRIIMVTDKGFYNMKKTSVKRRIDLTSIIGITTSVVSTEFVLHVPSEYDYRFSSMLRRDSVVNILKSLNSGLKMFNVPDVSLKKYTTTKKDKEKHISRVPKPEELVEFQQKEIEQSLDQQKISDGNQGDTIKYQQIQVQDQKTISQSPLSQSKQQSHLILNEISLGSNVNSHNQEQPQHLTPITLDDFSIIKVLGRGTFGKVMMVQKKTTGEFYAMKSVRKEKITNQKLAEYLRMEKQVLETVDHPFLVKLKYTFQTAEKIFFVMDFLKGGEVFQHLKTHRCFSEEIVRFFAAEVLLALEYLHGKKIIYRDLKPENVLLDENGHVCITDFGMAKQFQMNKTHTNNQNIIKNAIFNEASQNTKEVKVITSPTQGQNSLPLAQDHIKPSSSTSNSSNESDKITSTSDSDGGAEDHHRECSNSFVGTPQYLSPEIISRSTHTYSTDVWQLGLFIYELTVGYPPFFHQSTQVVLQLIGECRVMYPQHVRMSEDCRNIISAMLQKDPAARITLEQAKSHPWFKSIDWEKLARKELISPFIPPTSGNDWVNGFDEDFTSEPPLNSYVPAGYGGVVSGDQKRQSQQNITFDSFKDYSCEQQNPPNKNSK